MDRTKKSLLIFLVIWAGQLLSRIGSGISAFALGVFMFRKSGSITAYSLLLLAAFLPSVMLAPIGGVIADRKNRKYLMALGDIGSSSGILFIIVMLLIYPEKSWPFYPGIAISSLFAALHSPAFKASVTDLLDEKEYVKASGLIQFADASRYLAAPCIAALLLADYSLPCVLAIDMMTFLVAALSVILVRKHAIQQKKAGRDQSFREDFIEGIRYLFGNKIIYHLLCLTTIVTFITGILQSLFVPIVLSFTSTEALGIIQSMAASGMLVSSLCIGLLGNTWKQYRVLSVSLYGAGLFYLMIGASTNPVMLTITAFGFFSTLPFVNTSLQVLFRQNIDARMQGRTWSLISLVSQSGMLAAYGIAGFLADRIFNPMLNGHGHVPDILVKILGTRAARGSGFMIILCGCMLLASPVLYARRKHMHAEIQTVS